MVKDQFVEIIDSPHKHEIGKIGIVVEYHTNREFNIQVSLNGLHGFFKPAMLRVLSTEEVLRLLNK
jgi:hypothetical protein